MKIELGMTLMKTATILSEGNPGAVTVLVQLFDSPKYFFHLDTLEIYGSDIWVLYKDVCGEDIILFKDVLEHTTIGNEITIEELRCKMENGIKIVKGGVPNE